MTIAANMDMTPSSPAGFGEWLDRQTGRIMLLPAIVILLAFAIFPLIISAYLSVVRFALAPGGFKLTFVGLRNFQKLLLGSQQYHFLGTTKPIGPACWIVLAIVVLALLFWLGRFLTSGHATVFGFVGRLLSA